MFDPTTFYSSAPDNLLKAQKLLEAHIEDFAIKCDNEADLLQKYREKRSKCTSEAREISIQATLVGDIVKGECAKEKADYLKANGEKKTVQYRIEAMKERIYSIRHLSKGIEHQIKTQ